MLLPNFLKLPRFIVNYILPARCLACEELTATNEGFCANCWHKLNFITKPYCNLCGHMFNLPISDKAICGNCARQKPIFDSARSLLKFDQYSKKIIHDFKYYDKTEAAKIFAKLICRRYGIAIADIDLIAPVPMNKLKRLVRMYNQAQLLAKEIANLTAKPLQNDLLIKTKWTKSQAILSKSAREKNLAGSLKFNNKYCIQGKAILLIDDVMTTGSTIKRCSSLLKKAGAKSVHAITIAMT